MKIFSMTILPLIQEEQLSVNGKDCTPSTGKVLLVDLLKNSVVK